MWPEEGKVFLGEIFHRIHALRTALALQGQLNVGQAQKDLKTINDAAKGHVEDINNLRKAWQHYMEKAPLARAAIAVQSLTLQLARNAEPVLNPAARGITYVSKQSLEHPHVTQAVEGALAATLLSRGAASMFPKYGAILGKGRLGKILGGKG